jgi:transcriptional regulator with XRE-family HTH domain
MNQRANQQALAETTYGAVAGSVLAFHRKSLGWEQGHLANELGITQATWSRLEGGHSPLTIDQLARASESLGVPLSEMLRRIGRALDSLARRGVTVRQGSPNELAKEGLVIIAAVALGALVMAALTSK